MQTNNSDAEIIDIIKILNQIPIFQGFSKDDLMEIIPLLEPLSFKKESLIIKEGSNGDSMFIIKNGTVAVTKSEKGDDIINLGSLYSGSYFGELSLLDNLPRSADVTTIEDTEIFKLYRTDFEKLLNNNLGIANIFYKNCLNETFSRFRNVITNFTFSQHNLNEKSAELSIINKDLTYAKKIQSFFINSEFLGNRDVFDNNVKHSYIYHPCIAIGGDFLNLVKLDDGSVSMVIADFEGHGISAALGTGVIKSAFSLALKQFGNKPVKMMKFLNKHFIDVIHELYATCYYAVIDQNRGKIIMSKAGHHHPLFWKKDKNDYLEIDCSGVGLGLIPDGKFSTVEFDYDEGDKILFFTDGIIEQTNGSNEMYTLQRLKNVFRKMSRENDTNILEKLFKHLKDFADGAHFDDDVTLFLLEF